MSGVDLVQEEDEPSVDLKDEKRGKKADETPDQNKRIFQKVEASFIGVSMEPEEDDIKAIQEFEKNNLKPKMLKSTLGTQMNKMKKRRRPGGLQVTGGIQFMQVNNPRDVIESPCVAIQFTSLGSPKLESSNLKKRK